MNPYTHYLHTERLRRKMEDVALQYGRTHHVTLAYSRALDKLLQPVIRREFECFMENRQLAAKSC